MTGVPNNTSEHAQRMSAAIVLLVFYLSTDLCSKAFTFLMQQLEITTSFIKTQLP